MTPDATDDERVQRVIVASRVRDKAYRAEAIRRELEAVRREERRRVLRKLLGNQLVDGDEHICPQDMRDMLIDAEQDAQTPAE